MSAKKTLRKLGLESISGHKNDHCNAFIKYDVPGTILGPGTQQPSKLIKILPPWNSCLEVGVGQITSEILTVSDGDKWRKIKQARRWGIDGGVESRLQFKVEFLEGEREGGRG